MKKGDISIEMLRICPQYTFRTRSEGRVKAAKLYRRVAEYDTDLANDVMVSTFLISYEFIKGVVKDVFESKSS